MKTKTLPLVVLILIASIFSTKSFAQPAPGDSGGGFGGAANQPCPVSFKRNNGNGTCGGDAQIRLSFNQLPDFAPTLVSVEYQGAEITNIITPVEGDVSNLASKGYISYCLNGANIPPAHKITLHFRYANSGQEDCIVSE